MKINKSIKHEVKVGDTVILWGQSAEVLAVTRVCVVLLIGDAKIPVIVDHNFERLALTSCGTYERTGEILDITMK